MFDRAIVQRRGRLSLPVGVMLACLCFAGSAVAADFVTALCPQTGVVRRGADYPPGGIILTAFDNASLWVYNVKSNSRYPLPDTNPCGTNCRLSPDAQWVTYVDSQTAGYGRMHLDGTGRTPLVDYASDVEWWGAESLLVWTPGHQAYLTALNSGERQMVSRPGLLSVQPNGRWGVAVRFSAQGFSRELVDLSQAPDAPPLLDMGVLQSYYSAGHWSPDGAWLAYSVPAYHADGVTGAELMGIHAPNPAPMLLTSLTATYGTVRINGTAENDLSWSPDGTRLAFWVMPLHGANPLTDTGAGMVHILDVNSGALTAYCGLTISDHTPNPPRLVWSPDGTQIAFGVDVPEDGLGNLLLALDTQSGVFTILSEGIVPNFGQGGVAVWGWSP